MKHALVTLLHEICRRVSFFAAAMPEYVGQNTDFVQ